MNSLINYAEKFAQDNQIHIWLGGSYLHGNYTKYSDVDLSILCSDKKIIKAFISGYASPPIYLSRTERPLGILIILFQDGSCMDLEIIREIREADRIQKLFFHREDVKSLGPIRDEFLWSEIVTCDTPRYCQSRLFHRSLIKYLSGKTSLAKEILKEAADMLFLRDDNIADLRYKEEFEIILEEFEKTYCLPAAYKSELLRLWEEI